MITLKSCPNCLSPHFTHYTTNATMSKGIFEIMPGVDADSAIFCDYDECSGCRLVFQNPRMTDSELNIFYSDGYYRKYLVETDEESEKGQSKRATVDANLIQKQVEGIRSHLDIGCGKGHFLDKVGAKKKVGIEPDFGYVTAKGVKVYTLLSDVPKEEKFDLVSALHVLEHVPNTLKFLNEISKLVSKNGIIIIEVPSERSLGGPRRFAHLYYFESMVLKNICQKAGLVVISEYLTPHLMLICRVQNYHKL